MTLSVMTPSTTIKNVTLSTSVVHAVPSIVSVSVQTIMPSVNMPIVVAPNIR